MLTRAAKSSARSDLDDLRRREFARLRGHDLAYLDYTGSALYGESQLRAQQRLLESGLFGNPHSAHDPSRASTEAIDDARARVLRFLDVDTATHDVVFTASTTAAIKLVAEGYPFGPHRGFFPAADNHNSINGIREYARTAGARVRYLPIDGDLRLRDPRAVLEEESSRAGASGGLLAFPAQSNFSGVQHPLSLVTDARALGFDVLLDVAAFVPSHPLSLRRCPADFAVLSFYKLFGLPTGVGALVARREALARLGRPWFAGGTVAYATVGEGRHRLHDGHAAFEDGTPSFLGIASLAAGFDLLDAVGMERLSTHAARLARSFRGRVSALRHASGAAVARTYGPRDDRDLGSAVAFNVCDRSGAVVPYARVEERARAARVALRGGCFCNPGASEVALGIDPRRAAACLDALGADFTVERFAASLGGPVGALRVSTGLATDDDDVTRAVALVASFRE